MRALIHGERQQDASTACLGLGGFPARAQGGKALTLFKALAVLLGN